jgi:hypothetical protein
MGRLSIIYLFLAFCALEELLIEEKSGKGIELKEAFYGIAWFGLFFLAVPLVKSTEKS